MHLVMPTHLCVCVSIRIGQRQQNNTVALNQSQQYRNNIRSTHFYDNWPINKNNVQMQACLAVTNETYKYTPIFCWAGLHSLSLSLYVENGHAVYPSISIY